MSELPKETKIAEVVAESKSGPMKTKAIANALGVSNDDYRDFRELLKRMESEGKIYRVKGGRYAPPDRISLVTGRLTTIRSGDGFVRSDSDGSEVFVPQRDLTSAFDGDRVVARIESRPQGLKPVGSIIKVLERAHEKIVGIMHEAKKVCYATPLDPRLNTDVTIAWADRGEASEGDVVLVRITAQGERRHGPVGEVERVLGKLDDPGVDVLSILFTHGLSTEFPPEVEAEAERVAVEPTGPAPEGREDLRDLPLFTIDPADARDHDDALSWEATDRGARVGIHIADVSHYVRPDTELDTEALARGTSVYLVDRVVPMLPHSLSSNVCSLRPDVDRYAVSLLVDFDSNGGILGHRFVRSVIRSKRRLSYEDAQTILDGGEPEGSAGDPTPPEVRSALLGLQGIAEKLIRDRTARGAIDFDLPEARVILAEDGSPERIEAVERIFTHRLVETFMLLANEMVARDAAKRKLPVLYRIHEAPGEEKVELLRRVLAKLGIRLPKQVKEPKHMAPALVAVKGKPAEQLVSTLVLRTMQRARYSASNEGHFGLALDHYAHFTSPIRRYPDLVTHRAIVEGLIQGEKPESSSWESLDDVAEHTSWREQVANTAERDSVEMKKIEYLRRHLGEEFDGTVAGVKAFGAFVSLDDVIVDGLVHVSGLNDDYYEFDEGSMALVGTRRGRVLRLGDRVRVQVARVDKQERHVDLKLVSQ